MKERGGNNMDIEELYNVVFDDYGNIKVCGRQQTKQLILACQKIDSTMDFGDPRTGFMNITNICMLRTRLRKNRKES
jgi:hypothetical protein